MHTNIQDPKIIKNLLNKEDFNFILNHLKDSLSKQTYFEKDFGRYIYTSKEIEKISKDITPIARKVFKSKTLLPSYSLFAHYEGESANLFAHKDDNACTYTLDFCVYQETPWGICVEGKEYFLEENDALAFYGIDQEHWRNDFPDPKNNKVGFIFFHFVEPDHWFFTKGPTYIDVIRGLISESDWLLKK